MVSGATLGVTLEPSPVAIAVLEVFSSAVVVILILLTVATAVLTISLVAVGTYNLDRECKFNPSSLYVSLSGFIVL